MGRFSAYTNDSDSSDEQSQQSSEDELELVLEEGEQGERSPSPSPPPSSSPPPEPSPPEPQPEPPESQPPQIVPWPQQVGVDPQRVHVMQASLFRAPVEVQDLRVTNPQLLVVSRKHSRDAEPDLLRERHSFAQHVTKPLANKYPRVERSVVSGNERSIVDAGLFLGRSFRVGWGPAATLALPGSLCGPFASPKPRTSPSTVHITRIPTVPSTTATESLTGKLLQHHLTYSPIAPDAHGIPFASPSPVLRFSSLASLFPQTDRSHHASVFRLGHALFDDIDLKLPKDDDGAASAALRRSVFNIRRKAAVSTWLEEAVSPAVEANLASSGAGKSKDNDDEKAVKDAFALLTGNRPSEGCAALLAGGYPRLATLVAQVPGANAEFRKDVREQIDLWKAQRAYDHIGKGVRKLYTLIAGRVGEEGVSAGLDWMRAYGLHLWYALPGEASLSDVFEAYDQFWREERGKEGSAQPPYVSHPLSLWKAGRERELDAHLSLLRLQADPGCSLSPALHPLAYSSSPLDYAMPWHLYVLLSRCMRVRDLADRGHVVDDMASVSGTEEGERVRVEGHSPSADLLASAYAWQLEGMGLVQEATFVLLHIEGSFGRRKAIMDLLSRSAPKLDIWATRGLIGSLKIPSEWVDEAKAINALWNGDVYEAYDLYLSARMWDAAHDLAVLELAPDAINRRDLELLKGLLERFEGKEVEGWRDSGKRLLDYVHVMTRIPDLRMMFEDPQCSPSVREAVEEELEELTKVMIPTLMEKLPSVLPRGEEDPAHGAAVADMLLELSRVSKPNLTGFIQSAIQPTIIGGAAKLKEISTTSYERFLSAIQVS